ncbi:hypothetical protein [Asticcacaulis sp. W401b]|uniref:hypothetical protein n=1 Tax=Asticcacaulis sp. W401b TaxID=3388666 RepID=UPI003970932B
MRLNFIDSSRPKKAAQKLSKFLPGVSLSRAQQAVARAAGYSSWYELEHGLQGETLPPPDPAVDAGLVAIAQQIGIISAFTERPQGDVLYALSKTHLNGGRPWTLEEHLALRLRLWREAGVLHSRPHEAGAVVRVTGNGREEIGILLTYGGPSRAMLDAGPAHRADFEIKWPEHPLPDFLPAYLWLPYGYWVLEDKSIVVFGREYMPLWHIHADGVTRLPPWLWIDTIVEEKRFADNTPLSYIDPVVRRKAMAWLEDHGVTGLPMLAETLPDFIIEDHQSTIQDAVYALRQRTTGPDPVGPWHVPGNYK